MKREKDVVFGGVGAVFMAVSQFNGVPPVVRAVCAGVGGALGVVVARDIAMFGIKKERRGRNRSEVDGTEDYGTPYNLTLGLISWNTQL